MCIYLFEFEIKDTTYWARFASYHDLHLKVDSEVRVRTNLYEKMDYFNFPMVNFPFICKTFQQNLYMGYIYSILIRYSEACGSYHDFLNRELLLRRQILKKGLLVFKLSPHLESFTVITMTWLTNTEYLCHRWPWLCFVMVITIRSFPHSWLITEFVTRVTRWVPLVEQELLTLPET